MCEPQRVLARSQRSPRDFELQVERTKLEVGRGNITHQRADNRFTGPFCRQQICPGSFGGAAVLPPKIELPGQREIHLICARFEWREILCARRALIHSLSSRADRRQLVSACDTHLSLGLQDPRCGDANIVVLLEGRVDQILKLLVLKHLPPFLVCEGFRRRLRCLFWRNSAIRARNVYTRPLIVRPHSAARKKKHNQAKSDKSSHVSPPPMGSAAQERECARRRGVSPDAQPRRTAPE